MKEYKNSKSSLEGLDKDDVSYFADRILERDEDQRIEIEPLDNSYALEWGPLDEEKNNEDEIYDENSDFDRLRRCLLHSSPRKDDPKYKDIMDRRLNRK